MMNNRRNGMKHALAAALFCMVMSIGIICFADEKGTVTVPSAKIRASADTSSEQLGSVAQGGTVDIIGETTGADGKVWYQVYVDANTKGYIRADLVSKDGNSDTSSSNTAATDQTTTTATAVEERKGTVVTNNVRIRTGASTNHDVVATANRGMVVTVTGEADGADGNKWYQISFTYNNREITGFIRSDLVTFEDVPADTAVSEITGEENTEVQETETVPEETQEQEETVQESQPESEYDNIIPMNVEEVPYVMPGFVKVSLKQGDQQYNGYKNGNFYIFYAQKQNGEEGWFVFDSEEGTYQRYVYTTSEATVPDDENGSIGIVPVIILVVIIIILLAAVGLLVLKLREYHAYDDGYDEDEDEEYPDEDIEELEDLEEEEEEPQPVRPPKSARPSGQGNVPQGQYPVRRPQPQGQQPVRRPQPQGGNGQRPAGGQGNVPQGQQPLRRPQPQGGNGQRPAGGQGSVPQGQRPLRRPQPQGGNGQRPAGGQGNVPQGQQPVRRPQPQGGNVAHSGKLQPQKGYKAKNLLDDDDMDFMDL